MTNVKRDETNGITLLLCPFCGGEANVMLNGNEDEPFWWVECRQCHASTDSRYDRADTIAAWNTRAERTCKDANTRFNAWTCSECKCTLLLMFDDYGEPTLNVDGVASVPSYCPNCGAKVVDA